MIFVIIPHYILNSKLSSLALHAIDSFRKTSQAQIISVDDGSPVMPLELVSKSDKFIRLEHNSGFAHAVNTGIRWIMEYAKNDPYIVVANNDIEVYPGWEEALREPFEKYENVAVTGLTSCRVKEWEGKHISEHGEDRITEGGRYKDYIQQGGLLMTKKSVIEKVGIYDEQFTGGGMEDVDWFLRMRDTFGMKIVMSGKSVFYHSEGETRFKVSPEMEQKYRKIQLDNEVKFKKKWGFDYMTTANTWHENVL